MPAFRRNILLALKMETVFFSETLASTDDDHYGDDRLVLQMFLIPSRFQQLRAWAWTVGSKPVQCLGFLLFVPLNTASHPILRHSPTAISPVWEFRLGLDTQIAWCSGKY
jgi:hypothetical protein